jgi:transposase
MLMYYICNESHKHRNEIIMRGKPTPQETMFSYISQENRIPQDHPLRTLRKLIDPLLAQLSKQFTKMYSRTGRPSIPPEYLLRATLIQIMYTIRSERLLMEQLDYNLLFRWFVGLSMDDAVWDHSVFSKNRDRLLEAEIAKKFLAGVVVLARRKSLLSDEHFTVDGTLIEAWASQKSFQKKDQPESSPTTPAGNNPSVNFRGETRRNDTHQSTTDPEARLYKKSSGSKATLSFLGHVMMENRNGLVVSAEFTKATGTAEREAAQALVKRDKKRRTGRTTLGADKAYDTREFVEQMRELEVTPHFAQNNTNRSSAIDERTTRHPGYDISQRKRKLVEEVFGWLKTVGLQRKTHYRGVQRSGWMFTFAAAVYNLIRIKNLGGGVC